MQNAVEARSGGHGSSQRRAQPGRVLPACLQEALLRADSVRAQACVRHLHTVRDILNTALLLGGSGAGHTVLSTQPSVFWTFNHNKLVPTSHLIRALSAKRKPMSNLRPRRIYAQGMRFQTYAWRHCR